MTPRPVYIAWNILLNAVSPVVSRVRRPGALGMDGDLSRVGATLDWLAQCLESVSARVEGGRVLELGPGRTCEILASFVLAGARSGVGVDTHLRIPDDCTSAARFRELSTMLSEGDGAFLRATGTSSTDVHARYQEFGLSGFPLSFAKYDGRSIPVGDRSVDLIFSRSVLEHVDAASVEPLLAEMRRVLVPGGVMIHSIDLRDHMQMDRDRVTGDWLDALTYPDRVFRAMFSKRPVSINRLRADAWVELFRKHGFRTLLEENYRLPLPDDFSRDRLLGRWRSLDEETLAIARVVVVLQ